MATPTAPTPPRTTPRLPLGDHFPEAYLAMSKFQQVLHGGGLDPLLVELIKIRSSQLNGCAYCLDMHTKDARAMGETDERMHLVAAWREALDFTEQERAALALAEAITLIADGHVPDDVWAAAEAQFTPDDLMCLVWLCAAINTWNRVAIATGSIPGPYRSPHTRIERAEPTSGSN